MSARTSVGSSLLISKYLSSKGRAQLLATYMEGIRLTVVAINQHVTHNSLLKSHLNIISSLLFSFTLHKGQDHYVTALYGTGSWLNSSQRKPYPLLPAATWTIARKLISQLACSSLSHIKSVLFFLSVAQTVQPQSLFANWWKSGRGIHPQAPPFVGV